MLVPAIALPALLMAQYAIWVHAISITLRSQARALTYLKAVLLAHLSVLTASIIQLHQQQNVKQECVHLVLVTLSVQI